MPKPRINEKSKDFKGTIKKLINNLAHWRLLIIIALVLAMLSSIASLITPNKLSKLTDLIKEGLEVRTDNLELITKSISSSITEESLSKYMIIASDEDKEILFNVFNNINNLKDEEKGKVFLSLPDHILSNLLKDIKVENTLINVDDQIKTIHVLSNMSKDESSLSEFDNLPSSVYSLVKPKMKVKELKKIAIIIAIILLASSLFSFIQSYSLTTVSNRFAFELRKRVINKINSLKLKYFDTHETGDILSRMTNDIDTIAQNMNNSISTLVSSVTLLYGSVIMMFYTNWIMAFTAILSSLIGFLSMGGILGKSQKYFEKSQKALGDLNGYIEEMYSGHNVLKSYNGVDESIKDFEYLNESLNESKKKSIFLSGTMQPIMGFIGNLGYVSVCIVGAILAIKNSISFGVIVAFIMYVRLFTNPLSQIAQAMTNLQSVAAAAERIFEFTSEEELESEQHITKELKKEEVKGNVEFKNVKFGYNKDKVVIKDFSAKVKSGDKVAIVGPTGAGKTTIVNLLMKFYQIDDGDILIDGISINDLSRDNIHDLFTMVLQDTWLFDGSIKENIKFNNKNISDEEIWNVLKVVGIDHFVKTLPGGLDSKINDTDTVSSGQKQLFTIARGMIENSPLLILDEATSNVDTRTEELVQKAMDKLSRGKTSFIIAHRLSTIKNADLILVMDNGNIVEAGNHEELLKKDGFYANLYNSQFEKTNF